MQKNILFLVVIGLLFSNFSCKSKKNTIQKETKKIVKKNANIENSNFKVLLKGSQSNFDKPSFKVFKNDYEMEQVYSKINSTRSPGFELNPINFDKNHVVGLFMGLKNSSGFSITIDHIDFKPDETVIEYTETTPKGRVMTVMTTPFLLAIIKKTDVPIRFQKIE